MTTNTLYDPNGLLDAVMAKCHLKNDAALSRFLEVAPPVVSKMRHFTLAVGASMIIKIMDHASMTLSEVRFYVPGAA